MRWNLAPLLLFIVSFILLSHTSPPPSLFIARFPLADLPSLTVPSHSSGEHPQFILHLYNVITSLIGYAVIFIPVKLPHPFFLFSKSFLCYFAKLNSLGDH